jgi:hypothetical protein
MWVDGWGGGGFSTGVDTDTDTNNRHRRNVFGSIPYMINRIIKVIRVNFI